jgi:uncharacterized protein YprB with RNaseH-like and TPR domain
MDQALTAAKAANAAAPWSEVAAVVTAKAGTVVTADAVRNRSKRIEEQAALDLIRPPEPVGEEYFAAIPTPEDGYVGYRMTFWDIEATGLSAIMGRLICVSFADNWGNVTTRRVTDFPQTSPLDDSGLAVWARDELEKYDIAVGWYSTGYDIGMLNARLMRWGERPIRSDVVHLDPIYKARGGRYGVKIGSSKLDNVAKFFRLPVQKTEIDWDVWALAGMGDESAMDEVVRHCEADVLVTRLAFHNLKPLLKTLHR